MTYTVSGVHLWTSVVFKRSIEFLVPAQQNTEHRVVLCQLKCCLLSYYCQSYPLSPRVASFRVLPVGEVLKMWACEASPIFQMWSLKQASYSPCTERRTDLIFSLFSESFIQNFSVLYSPLKRHLIGSDSSQFPSQRLITEVTTDTFWEVVLQKQVQNHERGKNQAICPYYNNFQSCSHRGEQLGFFCLLVF